MSYGWTVATIISAYNNDEPDGYALWLIASACVSVKSPLTKFTSTMA